jgi:putative addiction module component (TIGR02574 family)
MVECGLNAGYVFFMPMTLDQIVEETRQLPVDVVAELVDRILLARHGGIERRIEAAWKTEIERRIAEIDAGKVQGIPVEESLARLRKSLGQ